jgi:hypothetical protein
MRASFGADACIAFALAKPDVTGLRFGTFVADSLLQNLSGM